MTARVEVADPFGLLDEAASVMQEAWSPPCLVYDAPYLGWQLSFPSRLPRIAAAARDGDSLVGFAAATSRLVEIGAWSGDVAVVSFVSVRPAFRGQRIADRLYDALLGELRARSTPVVTFAEPGSVGERVLVSAYQRAGFERHELGMCNPFGCISQPASPRARIVEPVDLGPYGEVSPAGVRLSTEAAQLRHFAADPRRRCAAIIRDDHESAAVMAVAAPIKTAKGQEIALTIDVAFAPVDAVDALRDAANAVASNLQARSGSMVVFHNVPIRDSDRARVAGLRRLPARYGAHLCLPPELRFLAESRPRGTNLDVV